MKDSRAFRRNSGGPSRVVSGNYSKDAEELAMTSLNSEQLPYVTSSVERFLINPDGNADGMILFNGVEVYFAPYLSAAVLTAVHVGDRITVYGVLPMAEPMIVAVVIEAANGARIEDCGLPTRPSTPIEQHRARDRLEVEALVRRILHGPDGEPRGVLLDDGTTVLLPIDDDDDFSDLLSPASWLTVRGAGLVTDTGMAIEADEIGPSAGAMRVLRH
jgi:hypothetical protein